MLMTPGDPHIVVKRTLLHFPGFEPLDAAAHRTRYARTALQSGRVWDMAYTVGPLDTSAPVAHFDVDATGHGQQTQSRVHLFDIDPLVAHYSEKPLYRRLAAGYASALRVVLEGGLFGYFRHAWRFGLFFVFPFLLVGLALLFSLALALLPVWAGFQVLHCLWSVPAGLAFFRFVFLPQAERLHTLHLFADWELAVAMARLETPEVNRWLETATQAARQILVDARRTGCDEILVTSHSMGSTVAAHVLGTLVEKEPDLMSGQRIVFVTLGGAILQCALLRSASRLRDHVGRLARVRDLFWLEVQCLTDSVHFYKSRVVAITGHPQAPPAHILTIRLKQILSAERYKRIKLDFLRVHRQYVLGPDRKASYDFTLMTAGPLPASAFAEFSPGNLPDPAALAMRGR
jgi:hypothetical protein